LINMADPENFEEDLFADLYEDNDASKTGPGPQPPQAPAAVKPEADGSAIANNDSEMQSIEQPQQYEMRDDDEDDDEVDFNLGGGSSAAAAQHPPPAETASSPPPFGTVHKASAKEDG
jgi:RNA-binding protein Musashi